MLTADTDDNGSAIAGREVHGNNAVTKTGFCSLGGSDVQKVAREPVRLIDLGSAELDYAFFPAHPSVALTDTVFNPQPDYCGRAAPIIERRCLRCGLSQIRVDRESLPPAGEEAGPVDLLRHHEDSGPDGMQDKVFGFRYCPPGTGISKSDTVRLAAAALRGRGTETLQDAVSTDPEEIGWVPRPLSGIGRLTIRMLPTYLGHDDFVKGDRCVIGFVSDAVGSRRTSAETAEQLVTAAAGEVGIAPRLPDNEIRSHELAFRH